MSEKLYNVRLITVDSCRFDTAQKAGTSTLTALAPVVEAEAQATYTYPSHHSMFIGILPMKTGETHQYLPGYDQIWRSSGARSSQARVFQTFNEASIVAHYQNKNYAVRGFGGVQFFNPAGACNSLPKLFEHFKYFGPSTYKPSYEFVPRSPDQFPLGNLDEIAQSVYGCEPYFLFINCPETHIPYDSPGTEVDDEYVQLLRRLSHEHGTKHMHNPEELPFSAEELVRLKNEQVRALEWIDSQLAILFAQLPNHHPTLTIVVGDHGEEFGDEGRFGHAHNAKSVRLVPLWVHYDEEVSK